MLGERMSDLAIDERGIVADRRWSVRTKRGKIGSGKTTRRFAAVQGLQQVRAHVGESGVFVTLPDGTRHHIESAVLQTRLSELVGESVTLAPESDVSHFDDSSVSLIARASVEALGESRGEHDDESRFRPNMVLGGLEGFQEERWIQRRLRIGSATSSVEMPSPRCVMIEHATTAPDCRRCWKDDAGPAPSDRLGCHQAGQEAADHEDQHDRPAADVAAAGLVDHSAQEGHRQRDGQHQRTGRAREPGVAPSQQQGDAQRHHQQAQPA